MPTSKLTVMQIKSAKPKDREYKIWDGLGLFLLVKPSGSKLWRRKYRFEGKEKLRSFGPFPIVSLEQVRILLEEDLTLIINQEFSNNLVCSAKVPGTVAINNWF